MATLSALLAIVKLCDLRFFLFNFKLYCLSTLRLCGRRAHSIDSFRGFWYWHRHDDRHGSEAGETFIPPFAPQPHLMDNKFQYFSHAMKSYLIKIFIASSSSSFLSVVDWSDGKESLTFPSAASISTVCFFEGSEHFT